MPKPLYVSHRDDTHQGGKAPIQAHMGLQTGRIGDPDGILGIPPGSHVFFIEDPRQADTIIECILEKVIFEDHKLKGITLIAYSKSMKTTRRLHLTAVWTGQHVSALDDPANEAGVRRGLGQTGRGNNE